MYKTEFLHEEFIKTVHATKRERREAQHYIYA